MSGSRDAQGLMGHVEGKLRTLPEDKSLAKSGTVQASGRVMSIVDCKTYHHHHQQQQKITVSRNDDMETGRGRRKLFFGSRISAR